MIPEIALNNDMKMPALGLGTWQLNGKTCVETVKRALELGYRHIDTAEAYTNHREIGEAIEGFDRENLFITSKVWRTHLDHDGVIEMCDEALKELGTDYMDLLLIHWPNKDVAMKETFGALQELVDSNKIKSIGVSNFTIDHIKEAVEISGVPIVTNQVEFHPFLYQKELLDFCESKRIKITAYSPLARGRVLKDEDIQQIAEKHAKSPAQISLKWLLSMGLAVIPKASSESHLKQNMEIFDFELDKEDYAVLDNLAQERFLNPEFAEFEGRETGTSA